MDTAWILLAVELVVTVLAGVVVAFMSWSLTALYAEVRALIERCHSLDNRLVVLETRAGGVVHHAGQGNG